MILLQVLTKDSVTVSVDAVVYYRDLLHPFIHSFTLIHSFTYIHLYLSYSLLYEPSFIHSFTFIHSPIHPHLFIFHPKVYYKILPSFIHSIRLRAFMPLLQLFLIVLFQENNSSLHQNQSHKNFKIYRFQNL